MSKNFGKTFLAGYLPSFNRTYDTSMRYNLLSDEREKTRKYEEQQKQLEEQQKAKEWEDATNTMNGLLRGKQVMTTPPLDPNKEGNTFPKFKNVPYTPEERLAKLSNIKPELLNRYKTLQDMANPEQPKDEYVGIDYSNKDAVYGFNKRTNRLEKIQDGNPIYKPKKVREATGYNDKGEKTITEWYDDGTTKIIDTGYKKSFNSEGKEVETFDADKFNKTLNAFTEQDIKINRLKSEYSYYPDEATKYEINTLNQTNAATLYSLMPDDSKAIVDQFYDQLKGEAGKRGVDYTQFERKKQAELKKKFQIAVGKNFDGSSESYAKNRALILYSNFKYGYIE